ncbi:leucine-rich repeat protein [Tanacetum coccineum]
MDGERQALVEFKHGLVDEAHRLASWVSDESDRCGWAGIACDNITHHVHRIHLRGLDGHCEDYYYSDKELEEASKQRLRGNLSSSLLHLKQLRHLDLSCNDFSMSRVPNFIGSLGNLRYLSLSNSNFVEMIPPQLGNLSKLNILCLGSSYFPYEYTRMTNMNWLSSLRMLRHLDLSGVDLSKAIDWLQVISTFSSLTQLHLSNCWLLHIHPHVSSLNITSLSLLDLSRNNFNTSFPQWVFSISSLVSLDLTYCHFHGPLPRSNTDSIGNLTSLRLLHVAGNDFMNSSSVLKGFSSVTSNLISLDISSYGISSSVLDSLHNLTSLVKSQFNIPSSKIFRVQNICLGVIRLGSSGLSGQLPSQIGKVVHLEHLYLFNNSISGTIPDSIGRLSFLRTLYLRKNLVSGHIPFSIGQSTSLEVLHLSDNQLNGSLPESIGRLSLLKELDVSNNQLGGSLPYSISQLSKMTNFSFSSNYLSGVVTETHFDKLVSLKYLSGEGNNLILRLRSANWIPPFQLQGLSLNSWVLGPQFPPWLQSQTDMDVLRISNTSISSRLPRSFWRSFPKLRFLDMSQNHIQGMLSNVLATLISLDLSYNNFSGRLPHLSNDSILDFLDLSNNAFEGSLHHLSCPYESNSVSVLDLGNNHLSGVIPDCWEKLQALSFLNLENNNLSGGIPRTLGYLSSLRSLNMHGNKLSGRLPASLANLTNLQILQLNENELVGSIPTWLGREVSFLRLVNLKSNNFDGNIPHEICYLTHIQILVLADNNLSGNIPRCFNNFSVLSGKQIASNDTFIYSIGDVPDVISTNGPNGITIIEFIKKPADGKDPGEDWDYLGNMKALVSCDLSVNKLYGELPMSLSSLSLLSSFNVSYNNLTGRVPSSTQLQSFNESSFFGNKLCGDPLVEQCARVEAPAPDTRNQEESHRADWALVIGIVLGFVIGFWVIVLPLILCRSWRISYFILTKI